jgi:hypothetical protein
LVAELKARISARDAAGALDRFSDILRQRGVDGVILFTRFASVVARRRLREGGVSYLDSTGNAWISLTRPSVFIARDGADIDPDPPRREVKSLKGAKAARIVRGLCDRRPPVGVRELARRTDTTPGYVSRVLSLLGDEDVVSRNDRGEVTEVQWPDLLELWARDYAVSETNRAVPYLAPRGLDALRERLVALDPDTYAITGAFAVPVEAVVAPGRVLTCYVASPEVSARDLDLRPAESGTNVTLLEAFDPVVFARPRTLGGLTTVAPTQCVVDLLTGSGREPAQGEALIRWMEEHEDAWRT